MSTKTLRKRIALVAVSALTAGLVSVVAVPSANAAAAGEIDAISASIGLLASDVTGTTTKTATLLSTGTLKVDVNSSSGYFVVSSGAYVSSATGTGPTIGSDQKSFTATNADNLFNIVPTGAVGSTFTVTGYSSSSSSTVVHLLTVTIAGSSLSGTVSPADSTLAWVASGTPGTTDASGKNTATTGNALYLSIQLNDAYAADITSTTGALVVTSTAGAFVALGTYNSGTPTQPSATTPTYTTAVSGERPSTLLATVVESSAGAGWSGSLTVTYNGVVIGTKTGTISGAVASIAVTPKKISKNDGNATTDAFEYVVKDKAGNALAFTSSNLVLSKSSNTSVISAAVGNSTNATTTTAGKGNITCVSGATGSADVTLQTTLSNGTVVKSSPVSFKCGGDAYTYKAAFDKTSYAAGDIAKLAITFYDADGALANSSTTVSDGTGQSVTASQLTAVGLVVSEIPAATYVDVNGQLVITYTVGTTEGAYQALVDFKTQLSNATVQTAAYKITSSGAVSNADVLKAIVSLIASINKQIAALQKALLKK